jgi:hypothetical protein
MTAIGNPAAAVPLSIGGALSEVGRRRLSGMTAESVKVLVRRVAGDAAADGLTGEPPRGVVRLDVAAFNSAI